MVPGGLLATVGLGWRDAARAARRAPLPVVLVTVALFALSFVPDGFGLGTIPQAPWLLPTLADGLRVLVAEIVAASLAIPIYRVLLDGRASGTLSDAGTIARYVAWLLLLSGWSALEHAVFGPDGRSMSIELAALTVVRLVMFYIGIRLMLVFPSVAIGDDRRPASASWKLTKGHFWWLLIGSVVGNLPSLVLSCGAIFAVMHVQHRLLLQAVAAQPHWFDAATGMLSILLRAGFTARIYNDWKGPAVPPARRSSVQKARALPLDQAGGKRPQTRIT